MSQDIRPDPNKDRNDPMVPEYWELGERVQDRIRAAGFESERVEGIAVDIHDLLQAADAIRDALAPAAGTSDVADLTRALGALSDELDHIRWHCDTAITFLEAAQEFLSPPSV